MSGFKRFFITGLALILVIAIPAGLASCSASIRADDLMKGIKANKVEGRDVDSVFIDSTSGFSIDLFKRTVDKDKNSLVSPLSVLLALSMTANGAGSDTLSEMEGVLGGSLTIDDLNKYLYTYANSLSSKEKSRFGIANSIWFRDKGFEVNEAFLQKNADYYGADAYKSPFDRQTVKDINNWVKNNTDGLIDKIVDEIPGDTVMYLLNAIVFDAEWEEVYRATSVQKRGFTNIDGSKVTVDMMSSSENKFIRDDNAKGFIKPYKNGDYSFVAILPDENMSIHDYINSLTGESFLDLVKNAKSTTVHASLPKFSYDYEVVMNDALVDMGMKKAFNESADFSGIGKTDGGNIYIGEVLHKTFISVDERGTKAGAVTKVEMKNSAALEFETVILDRPFVYAIIDNATGLPVFIGTVVKL